MSVFDLIAPSANAVIIGTFGVPVTYFPEVGSSFTLNGVFERYDRADPRPESPYCNLFCLVSDFPAGFEFSSDGDVSARGDTVDVGDGIKRMVFEINLDNSGGVNLRLVGR
jgi:hypothetical protein